tara:strand:+ start:7925 stop:8125 length:201 start_codon:yes stop_codon:yes gene_type:complete
MLENINFILWVAIVMGLVLTSYAASTKQLVEDTKQEFGLYPSHQLWNDKESQEDIKRYYGIDTGFE